jgi:hypothetical protein
VPPTRTAICIHRNELRNAVIPPFYVTIIADEVAQRSYLSRTVDSAVKQCMDLWTSSDCAKVIKYPCQIDSIFSRWREVKNTYAKLSGGAKPLLRPLLMCTKPYPILNLERSAENWKALQLAYPWGQAPPGIRKHISHRQV